MTGREIERKFLIKADFMPFVVRKYSIIQGFLSRVPERSIRVRIMDNQGFLTIKGIGNATGTTRFEWEKKIPVSEAEDLLQLCEPGIVDKTRYIVPASGDLFFEIDVFHGENEGLVLAEIELKKETEQFEKPYWLGREVTGVSRYFNSELSKNPYKTWKNTANEH